MTPPSTRSALAAAALVTVLAACSSPAGPSPSQPGSPAPSPSPTAAPGAIVHPTGATDVVLRFEEGGGFVPIDFFATFAPSFTLYGDGTVVYRDPSATGSQLPGGVFLAVPFEVVHLDEDAVQALLARALGPGGLATAGGPYMGLGADVPTATFTISVDGRTKEVSVTGLSPDMHPENALIVTALAGLAADLQALGARVGGAVPYQPTGYRGILTAVDQAIGPVMEWPWPAVSPDDFTTGDNQLLLTRTLSPEEVAALGISGAESGLTGLTLRADAQLYSFGLRPLLPDETA